MKRKTRVTHDPIEPVPPPREEPSAAAAWVEARPAEEPAIESLRDELQQERDRSLRARADFDNYRRRVERERDLAARQAKRDLLRTLIDLADGFDRALAHVDESPASVAAGLHGMQRRLNTVLEAEGVKGFDSVGQRFDPTRHEAVATVRNGGAPGIVVDEAGRGYLWSDELLRPALVRVAE